MFFRLINQKVYFKQQDWTVYDRQFTLFSLDRCVIDERSKISSFKFHFSIILNWERKQRIRMKIALQIILKL